MKTKKILLVLPVLFLSFILLTTAQNQQWGGYDVQSQKVLATAQGYHMTEGLFNKALRFTEFLLGTKITEAEKQQGLQESIVGFQQNPMMTIQETEQLDAQMQMLYQLTDPTQIALARSAMICHLYVAFLNTPEQPVLRQLMNKYTYVLAYDPQNMLAFTEQDFQSYLEMMVFNASLYGQTLYFDETTTNQYRQYYVNQFIQGTLELRQSLCISSVLNEYVQASYQNLSQTQQQDFQATMYNYDSANNNQNTGYTYDAYGNIDWTNPANIENMWPEGVNTKAEKQAYLRKRQSEINSFNSGMQMMNNMNLENHATMLNVINNMGGGDGSYWEVKYNDW